MCLDSIAQSMETTSADRRITCNGDQTGDIDRISNLPDEVLYKILLLLPIRTIARTSILSRRWNSLWFTLPDLDFTTMDDNYKKKTIHTINEILRLRDRNVGLRTLRVCAPTAPSTSLIRLMRLAVSHDVQELDITVCTSDYFNFTRCVKANRSLRVLSLVSTSHGLRLPPPRAFQEGFASLTSLFLSKVNLSDQPRLVDSFSDPCFPSLKKLRLKHCLGLKQLRVSRKLLEEFYISNCFQLNWLEVAGSKLKRLRVSRCFDADWSENWVKVDAPKLEYLKWNCNNAMISANCLSTGSLKEACVGEFLYHEDVNSLKADILFAFFSAVSHVETLTLEDNCFEIFSSKIGITRSYQPFNNLKTLELRMGFARNDVNGLLRLFKSCPTLQKFVLNIIHYRIKNIPESEESWTEDLASLLDNLNVVEIRGLLERKNEVSLVTFLLKHGEALTEISVRTDTLFHDCLKRKMLRSQFIESCYASLVTRSLFNSFYYFLFLLRGW